MKNKTYSQIRKGQMCRIRKHSVIITPLSPPGSHFAPSCKVGTPKPTPLEVRSLTHLSGYQQRLLTGLSCPGQTSVVEFLWLAIFSRFCFNFWQKPAIIKHRIPSPPSRGQVYPCLWLAGGGIHISRCIKAVNVVEFWHNG